MYRNILLVIVTISLILGLTFLLDDGTSRSPAKLDQASETSSIKSLPAPDFSFVTHDGKTRKSLTDLRGKIVLLNFWASWCAPCIIEFPKLEKLADTHKNDLVILAISADTTPADINLFLKKINFLPKENFLIVHDKNKAISQDLFQTIRLPETIIIDPSGNMVRKVIGDTDWTGDDMKLYLTSLVSPQPIP